MKTNLQNLLSKLAEYILFTITACVIIYYLFKNVYGTRSEIKQNTENIKALSSKMDTIYAFQNFTYQTILDLRNRQNEAINAASANNQLLNEYNKELSNLKRVVSYKVGTGNVTLTKGKRIVTKAKPEPAKNYITLDSFFRAKYQDKLKE